MTKAAAPCTTSVGGTKIATTAAITDRAAVIGIAWLLRVQGCLCYIPGIQALGLFPHSKFTSGYVSRSAFPTMSYKRIDFYHSSIHSGMETKAQM